MTPSTARVAIVTGGSGGIGQAVAERLARDGLSVVVHYAGNSARAGEVVETITSAGGTAICARADVADERAVARLFDLTERTYGGVDVVVHAAGRMDLAPLADMDLDVLDQMLRTNVRGTFVVDQQAARRLSPGGSILNFSSSVIGRVLPGYTGYAASKGAVEAMTFILAHELRGRDITVNAIAPGPTATPLFFEGKDEQAIDRFAHAAPLERLGTPADIAEVAAFLVSPAGHWVNGQTVRANGGLILTKKSKSFSAERSVVRPPLPARAPGGQAAGGSSPRAAASSCRRRRATFPVGPTGSSGTRWNAAGRLGRGNAASQASRSASSSGWPGSGPAGTT